MVASFNCSEVLVGAEHRENKGKQIDRLKARHKNQGKKVPRAP